MSTVLFRDIVVTRDAACLLYGVIRKIERLPNGLRVSVDLKASAADIEAEFRDDCTSTPGLTYFHASAHQDGAGRHSGPMVAEVIADEFRDLLLRGHGDTWVEGDYLWVEKKTP